MKKRACKARWLPSSNGNPSRCRNIVIHVLVAITHFFELLGVHRPVRYDPPVAAGDYDHALHSDHPEAPSFLAQYLEKKEEPRLGGKPKETAPAHEEKSALMKDKAAN